MDPLWWINWLTVCGKSHPGLFSTSSNSKKPRFSEFAAAASSGESLCLRTAHARHEAFIAPAPIFFVVLIQSVLLAADFLPDAINRSASPCSLFCLTGSVGQFHGSGWAAEDKRPSEQILSAVADRQTMVLERDVISPNEGVLARRPAIWRGGLSVRGWGDLTVSFGRSSGFFGEATIPERKRGGGPRLVTIERHADFWPKKRWKRSVEPISCECVRKAAD